MKNRVRRNNKQPMNKETRRWLKTASSWRLLSLLFQSPTRESCRELKRLGGEGPRKLAGLAREWAGRPRQQAETEFQAVFGPGGVPPVESSYDPNALAGRGPLLADIAGFHEAFAYRPPNPPAQVPDHIAVELDFLSYLAFKAAFALHAGSREQSRITTKAYGHFLEQHLCTWVPTFHQRLESAQCLFYARAASSVRQMAKTEAAP
jgi:TorA maturation chaperone TorD